LYRYIVRVAGYLYAVHLSSMKTHDAPAPAKRTSLTPDLIVQTAVGIADAQGVEAVTIRKVASVLGVSPMALYWHFRKKEDLLAAVVDWVYGQMDLSFDEQAGWRDQLRELIEAEAAVLRAHPSLASLVLIEQSMTPNLMAAMELALGVLMRAGFSPAEATQVIGHAEQTVVNLVAREPGRSRVADPEKMEDMERQMLASILALPPRQFPHIIQAAIPLSRCENPEEYYAFGIELLLAGITAMAERRASASDAP
jgi:TetR/AcrR family transcriptional regulator, tetracycline repressor protein